MNAVVAQFFFSHPLLAINKQNNMHATAPHTNIATKAKQGTIRVGNEQLLVITGALIARTVT